MEEKRSITFLPQIDGLRFVAVFGVMLHHWVAHNFTGNFILANIPFGTGVNLFFVISGFLITYILLTKKDEIHENETSFAKEIKNFYVKRTLRIFPIYYLLIIFLCVFSYEEIKEYLSYLLTYCINWFMVFTGKFAGNKTHLWSLAVEEQFYLIWPFIILLVPRKMVLPAIIVAILGSIASKIYFSHSPYWMGVNGATFSCFDSLGFGAIIAYLHWKKVPYNNRIYKILLATSTVLYILLFVNPVFLGAAERSLLFNFATSVVYFFIVLIAANSGFTGTIKGFLENKTVLYLGKISYGLYLYHNFAGELYFGGINKYFPSLKGDADFFVMYFIIVVILATLSWYLIERPILSLKKHFQ